MGFLLPVEILFKLVDVGRPEDATAFCRIVNSFCRIVDTAKQRMRSAPCIRREHLAWQAFYLQWWTYTFVKCTWCHGRQRLLS